MEMSFQGEKPRRRFRRVLLVTYYDTGERYVAVLCAGVGYVAESLRSAGISYRAFDYNLTPSFRRLRRAIKTFAPDLIAVGLMSVSYYKGYGLLADIKQTFPGVQLLVGGPHASCFRERIFSEHCYVDYVAILEAEQTLVDLCRGVPLHEIKGLMYQQDGRVAYHGDRQPARDLDRIAFPSYERFDLWRYPFPSVMITTSRGCPCRCTFCPVPTATGRRVRMRSEGHVVDELEHWLKRGLQTFTFTDDNFTIDRGRVLRICQELKRRRLRGVYHLGNGVRADRVDRELLLRMREVGFKLISFGVESANDDILRRARKGETIGQIETAVELACSLDYDVVLFFLVGLPGETEAHVQNSFRFARRYPVKQASFYNIVPFPGTELFTYLDERQLLCKPITQVLNETSHWNLIPGFVTPELDREARVRLLRAGRRVSREIRQRHIARYLRAAGPMAPIVASLITHPLIESRIQVSPRAIRLLWRMQGCAAWRGRHHAER